MYYFSEKFLQELGTKSETFQNRFFEIVDEVCRYLNEKHTEDFQHYIETEISYAHKGNILYSESIFVGGKTKEDIIAEICKTIVENIAQANFWGDETNEWLAASHIVVVLNYPDIELVENDIKKVHNAIAISRMFNVEGTDLVPSNGIFKDAKVYIADNDAFANVHFAFFR